MINNNHKTSLTTFYNSAISASGYRWQTPTAPEARGILAGAYASLRRRKRHHRTTRTEGATDRDWSCCEFRSGALAGREQSSLTCPGGCARGPPPA